MYQNKLPWPWTLKDMKSPLVRPRRDVEPASEVVRELQQKLEDVSKERDGLGSQVKILKVVKRKTEAA
jgi:hypothetical protein